MAASIVRDKIDTRLNDFTEAELALILEYMDMLDSIKLPADYDPDNDPSVGFFSADPQLASRTKEILDAEFGVRRFPAVDDHE